MKLVALGCLVLLATALLASLSWVRPHFYRQVVAAPSDAFEEPSPSQAFVVTFPEVSEWDGALLEMLRHKAEHCGDEVWIASHQAKSTCDMAVVEGTMRLLRASHGNAPFVELLDDLGAALVDIRTLGEGGLDEQLVVTGTFAAFALDRAAILRGVAPLGTEEPNWPPAQMFGWIPEGESRTFWQSRWEGVRDEDCRAYPVPGCEQKLDLAFSRVMNALPDEVVKDSRQAAAQRLDAEKYFRQNFGGKRSELCLRTSGNDYLKAYQTCLERFIDENVDLMKLLDRDEGEEEAAPLRKLI